MGRDGHLSARAAGMNIIQGEVRYPRAYRVDDMHVPYHGCTRCRATTLCPGYTALPVDCDILWLSGMHKCRERELQACRNKPPV